MKSDLMRFLAKAKLVDLSDDDRAALGEQADVSVDVSPVSEPVVEVPAVSLDETGSLFTEGESLEAIFSRAVIPEMPFPAEKLIKVLDGLRALDVTTRRTVVDAMDAADDTWTLADAVSDAERKAGVIMARRDELSGLAAGHAEAIKQKQGEINQKLESDTSSIRQQIQSLQAMLERVVTQATQEITALDGEAENVRNAVARESLRLEREARVYQELSVQFAAPKQ